MIIFERAGRRNTMATLETAFDFANLKGIETIVIASTYGDTALKALELKEGQGSSAPNLVVVTHNFGFKGEPTLEMTSEVRKELEGRGVRVHTGTMPFRTIGTAIRGTLGYSQQDLIANTLRLLGQGVKVCVEIVLMAFDGGLIGTDDVISVAGTGRGADTACVIKPAPSNRLFELKVRQILAKPFDW